MKKSYSFEGRTNRFAITVTGRGSLALPANPPKKEVEHPSQFASSLRKDPLGASTGSLRKDSRTWGSKRDLVGGSMSQLNNKNYLNVPINPMRRNSRNYSTDSLDGKKRNSWDPGRRGSSGSSCGWEEPIWEDSNKKVRKISGGGGGLLKTKEDSVLYS